MASLMKRLTVYSHDATLGVIEDYNATEIQDCVIRRMYPGAYGVEFAIEVGGAWVVVGTVFLENETPATLQPTPPVSIVAPPATSPTSTVKPQSLEETITRMRAEVLRDMSNGVQPLDARSYSKLHDFVDANGYGGALDEGVHAVEDVDYWNAAQDAIDKWLKTRRVTASVEVFEQHPSIEFPLWARTLGFEDYSYSNDACARSVLELASGLELHVWFNYPVAERELGETYHAVVQTAMVGSDEPIETLYEGESEDDCEMAVQAYLHRLEQSTPIGHDVELSAEVARKVKSVVERVTRNEMGAALIAEFPNPIDGSDEPMLSVEVERVVRRYVEDWVRNNVRRGGN